jgi:hypothetical protein
LIRVLIASPSAVRATHVIDGMENTWNICEFYGVREDEYHTYKKKHQDNLRPMPGVPNRMVIAT